MKGYPYILSEDKVPNGMEPYIITGVVWAKEIGATKSISDAVESPVLKSLKFFNDDWAQSDVRKQMGRCMRQNVDEEMNTDTAATDYLQTHIIPLCPRGTLASHNARDVGEDNESFKKSLSLSNFAVRQGSHHSYVDKGKLWSVRVAIEGTEQLYQ